MSALPCLLYSNCRKHWQLSLQIIEVLIPFAESNTLIGFAKYPKFPNVYVNLLRDCHDQMVAFDGVNDVVDVFKALLKFTHALSETIANCENQGESILCFLLESLQKDKHNRELVLLLSQALSGWKTKALPTVTLEGSRALYSQIVISGMTTIQELLAMYANDLEVIDGLSKVILMFNRTPRWNELRHELQCGAVLITVMESHQPHAFPESMFKALSCFDVSDYQVERVLQIAVNAIRASQSNQFNTNIMGLFERLTQSDQVIERVRALMMDNVTYRQAVVDMMRFNAREDSSNDASMFVYMDKWRFHGTSGDDENPLLSILGDTDGFCEALVACIERHNIPSQARILMGKMLLYLLKCHVNSRIILVSKKRLPALLMQVFNGIDCVPDVASCLGSITGQSISMILQYDSDGSAHQTLCEIPNYCEIPSSTF
jgi:hypothetical protein